MAWFSMPWGQYMSERLMLVLRGGLLVIESPQDMKNCFSTAVEANEDKKAMELRHGTGPAVGDQDQRPSVLHGFLPCKQINRMHTLSPKTELNSYLNAPCESDADRMYATTGRTPASSDV